MKRRKVWAVETQAGTLTGTLFLERKYATVKARHLGDSLARRGVPFVESHPGDVVLSREDVENLRAIVQSHISTKAHPRNYNLAISILRGGR